MADQNDQKPFWKKWWVWLIGVVLLIGLCNDPDNEPATTNSVAGNTETEAVEATSARTPEKLQAEKRAEYMERLERERKGLDSFDVNQYTQSKESIIIGAALFSAWAQVAEDGEQLDLNDQQQEKLAQFKRKVSQIQRRAFPKLRDAYGPIARKALWEHDLEAKTFGNGFKTIEFVGGAFAANRNIKQFQQELSDLLYQLRFKQSRYKWYDGASEYTYYDLDSHDDGELVVWLEGGRYRVVE